MTPKFSLIGEILKPLALLARIVPVGARVVMLGAAALVTVGIFALFGGSLQTFEENLGALGWTLDPEVRPEQRITIIAIDERSVAQEGWPFPRETMARLVTALDDAGVQLQLHDIVYPEARPGDDALLAALASARGAVLGQLPVLQSGENVRTGELTYPLTGISCGQDTPTASSFIGNNSQFSAIASGHISTVVASDGAVRKIPAVVCVDGNAYPALAISAFLQAVSNSAWSVKLVEGQGLLGPDQELLLDSYPGLRIPLDAEGNLRISYRNLPETYSAISAADVLNGTADLRQLENSWVLIGATAFGIGDIVPTPYTGATPGVELHARILGSLLDTTIPYTPSLDGMLLTLLSAIFALVLFALSGARERFAHYGLPIAGIVLPLVALVLHVELLSISNLWLGWVAPALYSLCAASFLMLLEQARVRHERSRVYGNLNAYLPNDVAREIAYSLPSSSVNARRSEVTLLSADLRNFSAFGESRPPEESAALLHFFFVRATEIVEQHGGQIHEFKGDGLLAVWDEHNTAAATQALKAARAMQDAIDGEMLPQRPPEGLEPLALGIGIEQGPVLIGSIGPAHRRTHTMLGDTVTITLRIQEMTAELGLPILIGECAARQLSDFKLESQGSYMLSGLSIPHTLFTPPLNDTPTRRRHDRVGLTVISGGRA